MALEILLCFGSEEWIGHYQVKFVRPAFLQFRRSAVVGLGSYRTVLILPARLTDRTQSTHIPV